MKNPNALPKKLPAAVIAGISVVALAGCGVSEIEPTPNVSPISAPDKAPETSSEAPTSQAEKKLDPSKPDINIIYIPEAVKDDSSMTAELMKGNDSNIIDQVKQGFETASRGRYSPDVSITVLNDPKFNYGWDELDGFSQTMVDGLLRKVKPFEDPDKQNIIVVDKLSSTENGTEIEGVTWRGKTPIVSGNAENLSVTIPHEFSHTKSSLELGIAYCSDPSTLEDCTPVDSMRSGDPTSVNSDQENKSKTQTLPELYLQNWLNEKEIIKDPESGQYQLNPDGEGAKVLILNDTVNGKSNTLYFSVENNFAEDKPASFTLQVRYPHKADINDTTSWGSNGDSLVRIEGTNGTNPSEPNSPFYSGENYTLSIISFDEDTGSASLKIEKNPK